jgi:hypothetical protein
MTSSLWKGIRYGMKDFKYILMISIVGLLIGARPNRFTVREIPQAANRILAFGSARNGLIGCAKPAQDLPPTESRAAPAWDFAPGKIVRANDDLSDGSVEEYAGEPEGAASQGSGYANVFDPDGHLLWRFAVLEHDNSQWTILKYSSKRTSKRRTFEARRTPQTQN